MSNQQPQRSLFGKIVKWGFIVFNILMLLWGFSALGVVSDGVSEASSDAEQVGAAIGGGIGMMLIGTIWFFGFVAGGIMLLLTRPK